tara:strand:+ start:8280 stop:8801 length:522 start_codon:yes stop_codon:yes gene_type:complete
LSPLLHVLLVGALAQGDVDRLLGEERFREALVASESLEGVERSRQRTLVLWSAGDLGGALQEARAGLTEGEDLLLRYYGVQLALELRDTDMAWRELDALETHRQSLGPDDPWALFLDEQLPELQATGSEVVLHGSARVIARSLATWIVGLSGFLALLIFGWSSLPSRRRRPGT